MQDVLWCGKCKRWTSHTTEQHLPKAELLALRERENQGKTGDDSGKEKQDGDGTGTPSFERNQGFASITDNGTGDYTVILSTAMLDTNYLAIVTTNTSGTQFGNALASSTTEINVTIAGSGGGAMDGRFSLLISD